MENILVPLPGFRLPSDLPWRAGFISIINDQARRLRISGQYMPPRYFGYFFKQEVPVGVAGSWTVTLDAREPIMAIPKQVDRLTNGQYSIESAYKDRDPNFILIHDRRDGDCNLWSYENGLEFVESHEPFKLVAGEQTSRNGSQ